MCVHLRRKDFLWGRPKQVPSIAGAAKQIRTHLEQLDLKNVFVATDASVKGNASSCLELIESCYKLCSCMFQTWLYGSGCLYYSQSCVT
jgi:hypothetical protein